MSPPTRRTVLASCATSSLVTGGCVGSGSERQGTITLCDVSIHNRHEEPIEVEIRVREDETIVAETAGEIEPADEEVRDGTETAVFDGVTIPNGELPDEPGEYHVRMRIAGKEWREMRTRDIGPRIETDHVTIDGRIERQQRGETEREPHLVLGTVLHSDGCPDE
ncbi:hypothetical protein [Natronobacterium texcoconense]|uniref:Uncharacterized protein n=1 Tax=Natronobacterium texcoconense TaxID=1095778 RepID=A0A1H1HXD8_NATTX|nr:hypothetical protein [Natronobacterium texcoconense]SDR29949.1 hypothetical protein SAMN04489842_3118 [Natronobacterium texcoconense]